MSTVLPAVIETPALDEQGGELVAQARAIVISDDATYQEAAEFAKLTRAFIAKVEEEIGPLADAAHKSWKLIVAKRDALKAHAVSAKQIVDSRIAAYHQEQERLRHEAEAEQRRERERLERAERERVAAENERRQREEEDRRIAAAVAAEARGDITAAGQIISQPVVVPTVAARPVFVPPVNVAPPPKAAGVTVRMDWDFEIEDEAQIPRQYLAVNEVAIRKVVKALKGQHGIPGIRAVEKPVTSVRS